MFETVSFLNVIVRLASRHISDDIHLFLQAQRDARTSWYDHSTHRFLSAVLLLMMLTCHFIHLHITIYEFNNMNEPYILCTALFMHMKLCLSVYISLFMYYDSFHMYDSQLIGFVCVQRTKRRTEFFVSLV